MADIKACGRIYSDITGVKATDSNGNTVTFEAGGGGEGNIAKVTVTFGASCTDETYSIYFSGEYASPDGNLIVALVKDENGHYQDDLNIELSRNETRTFDVLLLETSAQCLYTGFGEPSVSGNATEAWDNSYEMYGITISGDCSITLNCA